MSHDPKHEDSIGECHPPSRNDPDVQPPCDQPEPPGGPTAPDQPSTPVADIAIGLPDINISAPNILDGVGVDIGVIAKANGHLLDPCGEGDGLGLLGVNGETDALINVALQDGQGSGAADIGSLINAAVLDIGGTGVLGAFAHGDAYDGNVPLAGDLSSALGATLDHLTMSSSLFDVPALDVLCLDGLDA